MIHKLKTDDCPKRKEFCVTLHVEIKSNETIAQRVVFSHEETSHSSGNS
jgi:hypothetical protein